MMVRQRWTAISCVALSLLSPAFGQEATDAGKYRLVVIRGEGDQHNVKQGRSTSQAVMEVRDENDKPVAGVLLTFTLPSQGAGGSFVGGSQVTTLATNNAGRAAVTYTPNKVVGNYALKVSGNVQGQSVAASVTQTNIAAAAAGLSTGAIVAIVAVAAGAGIGAALASGGKKDPVGGGGPGITTGTPPGLRIDISPGGVQVLPRR